MSFRFGHLALLKIRINSGLFRFQTISFSLWSDFYANIQELMLTSKSFLLAGYNYSPLKLEAD